MENDRYPYVNLPLPYEYSALEPYIDTRTMEIHHNDYLGYYINNLNRTIQDFPELQQMTLEELIRNSVYLLDGLRIPIQNNGGGVYNHRFYFNGMQPPSDVRPTGRLIDMIAGQYGNIDNFLVVFKTEALKIFGSGYCWLVFDYGKLKIITMPNQNSPVLLDYCPLIALDVWEHAYFLKHYYMRGAYIDDWNHVINWEKANENFMECLANFNRIDEVSDVDF